MFPPIFSWPEKGTLSLRAPLSKRRLPCSATASSAKPAPLLAMQIPSPPQLLSPLPRPRPQILSPLSRPNRLNRPLRPATFLQPSPKRRASPHLLPLHHLRRPPSSPGRHNPSFLFHIPATTSKQTTKPSITHHPQLLHLRRILMFTAIRLPAAGASQTTPTHTSPPWTQHSRSSLPAFRTTPSKSSATILAASLSSIARPTALENCYRLRRRGFRVVRTVGRLGCLRCN